LAAGAGVLALAAALLLMRPETPPAPAPPPPLPQAAAPSQMAEAAPPAAMPAPSTEGLKLHGLLGAGAVIALPDGRQRWVRVGGDVLPGLRLEEVRQNLAVLASSGGRFELSFEGVATRPPPTATAGAAPPPAAAGAERLREDHLRYRLGFEPRRADGRITGFAIRRQADLPMLRRAGLQPGDVLVSVNGQSFDSEEKVQELASEIAGSFTADFEFERDGRRMRRSLEVNPRPQAG
jgi:type II secretion system protein C